MNWKYFEPKFEYEEKFQDNAWPWAGHKFFAYDLVGNLKPEKIVELGTHKGTSFFSFCQSAKDLGINVEINAVDTWQGDEHAGFYEDNIYGEVEDIIKKYYSEVNTKLIRKTFDEALSEFDDKSIDILHIDGLHTYQAVKNDFESWTCKVKDGGIILFHDISVTRDDFGVHKLWKELKEKYQTMEFRYSYGLGVLFKAPENSMFDLKDELELRYSYLLEDIENKKIAKMLQDIEQKEQIISKNIQEIQKRDELIRLKNEELEKENAERSNLHQVIQEKDEQILLMRSSKFWKIRNIYLKIKDLVIKK